MRVTTHSDYALRVLIYAALQGDKPSRIEDVAERYRISKSHLTKVVWNLSSAGFLVTSRGRAGGLRLARPAEEINLGDVMRATEDNGALVECFSQSGLCAITPACKARRIFREALEAFHAVFDKYTLADLMTRESDLREVLGLESA
jgi:Rrf2 family nitric oxide-sensitive transcriptional repressor